MRVNVLITGSTRIFLQIFDFQLNVYPLQCFQKFLAIFPAASAVFSIVINNY